MFHFLRSFLLVLVLATVAEYSTASSRLAPLVGQAPACASTYSIAVSTEADGIQLVRHTEYRFGACVEPKQADIAAMAHKVVREHYGFQSCDITMFISLGSDLDEQQLDVSMCSERGINIIMTEDGVKHRFSQY